MRQRGVALITAIVLVTIATMVAVHLGTRAALDRRRTAGLLAIEQGWHVALGAEAWASEVLREDWEDRGTPPTDHLAESWAQPLPPLPVDGGTVRGALEDMQGRFNVNTLINGAGQPVEAAIRRFERLLEAVEAEPRWARMLADWLDADTIPQFPDGAEDGVYLAQDPPYRAANGPITTTTEMLALPGMTLEQFERIRPYVAALPVAIEQINLCTAKAPVLDALLAGRGGFGDAETLATNRRDGCFPTRADVQAVLGEEFAAIAPLISETSNWFRAVTAVRIGTSELTLYSLIERSGNGGSRTVLRSTGTE